MPNSQVCFEGNECRVAVGNYCETTLGTDPKLSVEVVLDPTGARWYSFRILGTPIPINASIKEQELLELIQQRDAGRRDYLKNHHTYSMQTENKEQSC